MSDFTEQRHQDKLRLCDRYHNSYYKHILVNFRRLEQFYKFEILVLPNNRDYKSYAPSYFSSNSDRFENLPEYSNVKKESIMKLFNELFTDTYKQFKSSNFIKNLCLQFMLNNNYCDCINDMLDKYCSNIDSIKSDQLIDTIGACLNYNYKEIPDKLMCKFLQTETHFKDAVLQNNVHCLKDDKCIDNWGIFPLKDKAHLFPVKWQYLIQLSLNTPRSLQYMDKHNLINYEIGEQTICNMFEQRLKYLISNNDKCELRHNLFNLEKLTDPYFKPLIEVNKLTGKVLKD